LLGARRDIESSSRDAFGEAEAEVPGNYRDGETAGPRCRAVKMIAGCELRDPLGCRFGRASRVFVDRDCRVAHVEVAPGLSGSRTVLVPVEGVEADGGRAYPLFEEGPAGVTGRHQGGES
jgi:hypothetical protein